MPGRRRIRRTHTRIIIGHHLLLHGYGHWLPNDPRGSGSEGIRQDKLADLGPIHLGPKKVPPAREELEGFYAEATPRLDFLPIWFDDEQRQAIAETIGTVARRKPYTIWACAVLRTHVHLCVRRHRDDAVTMWNSFAGAAAQAVRPLCGVPSDHPIWSRRPYKVFLYSQEDIWRTVQYIEDNPEKEKLARQIWPFTVRYDGWPYHRDDAG